MCKYVAVADGDDYWTDPYKLQYQIGFLENNSDFSMCSGGYIVNNTITGEQTLQIEYKSNIKGIEYDLKTTYIAGELLKTFTRVYRTDALMDLNSTLGYKHFCDIHIGYHTLTKGKGFYFPRVFGVHNVHGGGIFNKLDRTGRIEFIFMGYEELYSNTRDVRIKDDFLHCMRLYVAECLNNKESIAEFYKEFVEAYPELEEEATAMNIQ
jgi:hypothetical protein